MNVTVRSSTASGSVAAPPSKSMTHRALTLAALARGRSRIRNPLTADDTEATASVLEKLGVGLDRGEEWVVDGGDLRAPAGELHCGESGTTLRFMAAVCALVDGECRLTGGSSLSTRPVGPLLDALSQLGVTSRSRGGFPPVTIRGTGRIGGGEVRLPGDVSSQFVSALLAVAPLAEAPVEITLTTRLESRPYVAMTMDAMRAFGVEAEASPDMRRLTAPAVPYKAATVTVEGDWSSAAHPLAAGALGGEVTVKGLNAGSSQADKAILPLLSEMGAQVSVSGGSVRVSASGLRGIEADLSDCPDLFPVVSALCAAADGGSRLTGLARLKLKESDRVAAMAEGLTRMGAEIRCDTDSAVITGGPLRGAEIDPWGDHRIAMSLAILALHAEGETTIRDAGCVSKSYPGFWDDLAAIGGRVKKV
ncbi:MAG: 3-phosphoshikimate 1-carboxyvinyltransferase [Candidatus Bathyarchaeia archaeon]